MKTENITVKVGPKFKAALIEAASKAEETQSEYIRKAIEMRLKKEGK